MKKDSFRLPVAHQEYDANATITMGNEVEAIVMRLLPIKMFRELLKDAGDISLLELRQQHAQEDEEDQEHHNQVQQDLVVRANTAFNAWNDAGGNGIQPPAHAITAFVQRVRQQGDSDTRCLIIRNRLVVEQAVDLFTTGMAMSELYVPSVTALAGTKISTDHWAALAKAATILQTALQGRAVVQSHSAFVTAIAGVILAFWRDSVQGYSADRLASATIEATQAILAQRITMTGVTDGVRQHCGAFETVHVRGSSGFPDLLAASLLSVCEPLLRDHLSSNVPRTKLLKWAKLDTKEFTVHIAEQAKLAQARLPVQVAPATIAVAALELQVAALQMQINQHNQQREEHPREERRDRHHRRGQQVGSLDYRGCLFRLPNGKKCESKAHLAVDHPT